MPDDKNTNTVQQYVADMVALESHIEEALDGQLKEDTDHSEGKAAIQRFHNMVKLNRDALKMHLEQIGGSESHPIKDAVASLFGKAAGAVNNLRTKQLSKSLRDDYTAFNHAAMGYSMLHVTAHALGDMRTMEIAERHLRAYAQAVQEINQLVASVVVWELHQEDGLTVNDAAIGHCTGVINRVWRETAPSGDMAKKAA
jgi:ferritin-like metal-binding protein YciE